MDITKIDDFKYKFDDYIIKIIPINSIKNTINRDYSDKIDISEFYLDNEFICNIYIDCNKNQVILDCEKDYIKFDYIEKLIKWLINNNPDIYDNYAYYYTCTYYKIKGY
jgi:hypothetical protein